MIEIRKLVNINSQELSEFGRLGYISNFKYIITRRESSHDISFSMELTKLNQRYLKEWKEFVPSIETLNSIISNGNSFGAFDGDRLVGYVISEKRRWNNSLWIEMIQVAESHRAKGVGSSLLRAVEEHASGESIRIIDIETQNTNVPAINFYKKNGYEFTGLNTALYDPVKVKYETAIFMAKKLKSGSD